MPLSYNERVTRLDRMTDHQLLDMRLCDLPLKIKGTRLEQRVAKLYRDLEERGLHFHPHVWLSEEWFTPDGTPGFAIPFYLAHPRLILLERSQMLEVEGASESECMRILRHEAGHAIDNAYGLHLRGGWAERFGSYRTKYPKSYRPQPHSRDYVLNLDAWYAQAHPAEDFAETFAVWLKPGSRWRAHYEGWGALQKLEYVDRSMAALRNVPPKNKLRYKVDPISVLKTTLREHYRKKRVYYAIHWPPAFERNLYRIFSPEARRKTSQSAAQFLRRIRRDISGLVAEATGVHPYSVNHIVRQMVVRCRQLDLRVTQPEEEARQLSIVVLTMQVMQVLGKGYHRIPL